MITFGEDKRISVSLNFYLDEFIDPYTYFSFKEKEKVIGFLDIRVIHIAQKLRDLCKSSLTINNWYNFYRECIVNKVNKETFISTVYRRNDIFKCSGYRSDYCKVGAVFSAHRKGRAIDIRSEKYSPSYMFDLIMSHKKMFYNLGVRRIEDIKITPTWLHIDTFERNVGENQIIIVDKKNIVKRIDVLL